MKPFRIHGAFVEERGSHGVNINAEFQNGPNLFGQTGSYLNFTGAAPGRVYAARELDRHKVGVLAYNVPQSSDCLQGYTASFEQYGPDVYGFDIVNPEAGPYDLIGVQAWFDGDRMTAWAAPANVGFIGDCG